VNVTGMIADGSALATSGERGVGSERTRQVGARGQLDDVRSASGPRGRSRIGRGLAAEHRLERDDPELRVVLVHRGDAGRGRANLEEPGFGLGMETPERGSAARGAAGRPA
jgi:hypothetical protein